MIFELQAQFIDQHAAARVELGPGLFLVHSEGLTHRARDLDRAIRIAAATVGPLMERGDRFGEGWGLMVVAGPASVAYGNWPVGPPGDPRKGPPGLDQILRQYRPGDGARAALQNAIRVIEVFAERRSHRARRVA
jgi:uncharacterized protein (DUF58 family)